MAAFKEAEQHCYQVDCGNSTFIQLCFGHRSLQTDIGHYKEETGGYDDGASTGDSASTGNGAGTGSAKQTHKFRRGRIRTTETTRVNPNRLKV